MAGINFDPGLFKSLDANPGGTLELFEKYIERMSLIYELAFRKSDGTPYTPSDREKKAMLLFRGGDDMKDLFQHVGGVTETDTYNQTIQKIKDGLNSRTNSIVQRNLLFANFPQGSKSFERWSKEVSNAAKLINFENYDWKQASVDAMLLQTTNPKLRERALQENITYNDFIKLGIAKEQSEKGASLLLKASGQDDILDTKYSREEVRRLKYENRKLKAQFKSKPCTRCNSTTCEKGSKCPAMGQKCSNCHKMNHYAKACRADPVRKNKYKQTLSKLSSAEESGSEISTNRIVVGKLTDEGITVSLSINGHKKSQPFQKIKMATDTGVSKTILNTTDWLMIRDSCKFVKTSKCFRPFGTSYKLPIKGKSKVNLKSQNGAKIKTYVYILDDDTEQSLLGKQDAMRLGIVEIKPKGAPEEINEVTVKQINSENLDNHIISGGQTQSEINQEMEQLVAQFPQLFEDRTGKFIGDPIKIQVKKDAVPIIQPNRRIPLHYVQQLDKEIDRMLREDIIEGPLDIEEPGTFISNLVITDKKWDTSGNHIRITLDCQEANKSIYQTHEPIPTSEELRHHLRGSDRFSILDISNCFHQFEIEKDARKLYTFRIPRGLFRFKRMVMGTSPASSEIQKRIRETIADCKNAYNIKDDILVHGVGREHDKHLQSVLSKLAEKGLTLRRQKCVLGQSKVKWFGNIYSKEGMSPDPEKCIIIQNWPEPTSCAGVKSFLQTIQFNAKFLQGQKGEISYPELTEPLRLLTRKGARFFWGPAQKKSFALLKDRLCSNTVMVPYDTKLQTRMYVDSSPVGTHATIAQKHIVDGKIYWRPVNHTSRSWTTAESGYSQIERESNGILTGMYMNRMYTLGTFVEIITDHKPLVSIYNDPIKPKQLRVDRHRTKLLPFRYTVLYESGVSTPCDYRSRNPPDTKKFNDKQKHMWQVEDESDILVNRVIMEDLLPKAVTLDMVKTATAKDDTLNQLIKDIEVNKYCRESLSNYKQVFSELYYLDGIVMRGKQILIPKSLQAEVIGLAHEGHLGQSKTKSLLRQFCWFPHMSKSVDQYVETCIPCQSANPRTQTEPLIPQLLPERPWQKLHADFKGPIGQKYYIHIVIDQYSKYPEVDIIKSTEFSKLEPCLDRIFATHGVPEQITTDNGPPYFSHEMQQYAQKMGFKHHFTTPLHPQGNGFAENFVKQICKIVHTSIVESKDIKQELNTFLLHYRAAPHSTTGRSPAELLFGRKIQTKLPQVYTTHLTSDNDNMRIHHNAKKQMQKEYFDSRKQTSEKDINASDIVLIKQQKTTTKPPFDPKPFKVTKVNGNQVVVEREGERKIRSKNHMKLIKPRPKALQPSWDKATVSPLKRNSELDIDIDLSRIRNRYLNTIDMQVQTQQEHGNNQNLSPNIEPLPTHQDNSLYDITLDEAHQMQSLLNNISDTPQYALRSSTKFDWNSHLNNEPAVIEQT